MDWTNLLNSIQEALGATVPGIAGALLIAVVGWIAALVLRAIVRRGLGAAGLNRRLAAGTEISVDAENGVAKGVYWVVLAMVGVAFFNALDLNQASGSLQQLVDQVMVFLPKLVAGGVLLGVAMLLATGVRMLSTRALAATTLDERLTQEAGIAPPSASIGNVLYGLVLLLFLPAILGVLELGGLLAPVQTMVDEILGHLPNVFGAGVLGVAGWFVARLLRDLVQNLLSATGADRLGERAGLQGNTTLSGLAGLLVYIFVLVPALIAALNVLAIDAISAPATEMLGQFMAAIPNLFAAGIILAVAWIVSNFVAGLLESLLGGMGFDRLPETLGVASVMPAGATLSSVASRVLVFFVMLFALVEAAARLGFEQMSGLVGMLIAFGGDVLLGITIIAVGVWISNLASDAVARVRGGGAGGVAGIVRFGILGIVVAMGLRAMGLADSIVNMAFGLTLGAVAVAVALSFGLGGREAAGRQMEHWLGQLRS